MSLIGSLRRPSCSNLALNLLFVDHPGVPMCCWWTLQTPVKTINIAPTAQGSTDL